MADVVSDFLMPRIPSSNSCVQSVITHYAMRIRQQRCYLRRGGWTWLIIERKMYAHMKEKGRHAPNKEE